MGAQEQQKKKCRGNIFPWNINLHYFNLGNIDDQGSPPKKDAVNPNAPATSRKRPAWIPIGKNAVHLMTVTWITAWGLENSTNPEVDQNMIRYGLDDVV